MRRMLWYPLRCGWLLLLVCGLWAGCGDDGSAGEPACTPADVRCATTGPPGVETCAEDGVGWEAAAACELGEFCEDGACQTGGCVPQCDGRSCGDDQCGDVCGVCPVGESCEAGQCEALVLPDPVGDDCTAPMVLDGEYPLQGTGDTGSIVRTDHYNAGETCGRLGAGAPEQVWVFEARITGVQPVLVEPDADFDAAIYRWDSCGQAEAACEDARDSGREGEPEEMHLAVVAGELVYLVVDGSGTSSGTYTLTLSGDPGDCDAECGDRECGSDGCGGSCGTCPGGMGCDDEGLCAILAGVVGDTCYDPHVIVAADLPMTGQGTTAADGVSDVHSASGCGGTGADAPEEVWSVEVAARASLRVTLVPHANFDAAIWFGTECTDLGAGCHNVVDEAGPGTTELATILVEQGDVFVVVDGVDGTSGGYDIEMAVLPLTGGDECADAAALTPPIGVLGTTLSLTDQLACSDIGAGPPDQFWALAEPPEQEVLVIVEPLGAFDPVIHLVDSCEGTCMQTVDVAGPGETEEAIIPAGADWRIVIDGTTKLGGVGLGDYTLRLE